jgi:hypothetical protein
LHRGYGDLYRIDETYSTKYFCNTFSLKGGWAWQNLYPVKNFAHTVHGGKFHNYTPYTVVANKKNQRSVSLYKRFDMRSFPFSHHSAGTHACAYIVFTFA